MLDSRMVGDELQPRFHQNGYRKVRYWAPSKHRTGQLWIRERLKTTQLRENAQIYVKECKW